MLWPAVNNKLGPIKKAVPLPILPGLIVNTNFPTVE